MADDTVTRPPAGPRRPPSLRALAGRGRTLAGRATELIGQAAGVVRTLPGALLPRGEGGDGSESITGYVSGHRMAAGARVARAAVTISFEGGELRVLQHFGSRVVGWGSFPLDAAQLAGGEVLDAAGLGYSLDDLFDRGGFSRRHVVGALSGRRARSALLEVPPVGGEADLGEAVAEEAARQLGHVPGESYLFWERAVRLRHGRAVFAVVIPQEPLLLLLEALETAHVRPESLDLKPLALARAANQRDAIIASLEADGFDVVIVADDLPVAIRSAPLPTGVSEQGAREHLVAEVVRALADCRGGRTPVDSESRVFVAGARADELLREQLRLQTGHEIGTLAPPAYYPLDFPVAEQLANVGLALKRE